MCIGSLLHSHSHSMLCAGPRAAQWCVSRRRGWRSLGALTSMGNWGKEFPESPTSRRYTTLPDISQITPEKIRNFVIAAHIDHGKSTLADRMLERTGAIDNNKTSQILDTLKVERERGITVRAQNCSIFYTDKKGETYLMNLIDTPGHVDFSSELLRSLLPAQGALVLVDAMQGIQAQTLSVLDHIQRRHLDIIGIVNKWDLVEKTDNAQAQQSLEELAILSNTNTDGVLRISAKTGQGVDDVLEAIVDRIVPPLDQDADAPLQALIFDSWHDKYRGVINLVAVIQGSLSKGDPVTSGMTKKEYTVSDVGLMAPMPMSLSDHGRVSSRALKAGMIGYMVCNMKDIAEAKLGDTLYRTGHPQPLIEEFVPPQNMVFAAFFPRDSDRYAQLDQNLQKLALTDRSVSIDKEESPFLGQGFRIGFSGSLHMDVFRQRLVDEFEEQVLVTRPSVPIQAEFDDGHVETITNPAEFPEGNRIQRVSQFSEPMIRATIIVPETCLGSVLELCQSKRGEQLSVTQISGASEKLGFGPRVSVVYKLPLAAMVDGFSPQLNSVTSGMASVDYEDIGYEPSDLVRLNVFINKARVDSLCMIIHRREAQEKARVWVRKMKEAMSRQLYEIVIQAGIGSKILARERLAPMSRDKIAGKHGGTVMRRKKHDEAMRQGKARQKERMVGKVPVSRDAFMHVMGAA